MLDAPVLLVVSPKPDDFDCPDAGQDLIHHAMLNIDSTRVGASQIAHEFLKWGRALEWIPLNDI